MSCLVAAGDPGRPADGIPAPSFSSVRDVQENGGKDDRSIRRAIGFFRSIVWIERTCSGRNGGPCLAAAAREHCGA
jgi:hypothetical protein